MIIGMLLALLFLLVVITFAVGILVMGITAPLFWWTSYGFVPYSTESGGKSTQERAFETLMHVVLGGTCFSLAFSGALVLAIYVTEAFFLGILLVPIVGWAGFVLVPVSRSDTTPVHWIRRSTGSFAVYTVAYVLGIVGLLLPFATIS